MPQKFKPKDKKSHGKSAKPTGATRKALSSSNATSSTTEDAATASLLPIALQQSLLDAFQSAFPSWSAVSADPSVLRSRIQTVKSALYNRDFVGAFASAENQEAYCLRWSPSRALAYMELLASIDGIADFFRKNDEQNSKDTRKVVVSIGGGAGAELVAFSGLLEWLSIGKLDREAGSDDTKVRVLLNAVDLADWSHVMECLERRRGGEATPQAGGEDRMLPSEPSETGVEDAAETAISTVPATNTRDLPEEPDDKPLRLNFVCQDILSMDDSTLKTLIGLDSADNTSNPAPILITIFFTLNELYSTSMPKTTSLLLRLTEMAPLGTLLLVVDSPGSYSTVKIGAQEKQYPMKWLLDHTLLEATRAETGNGGSGSGSKIGEAGWEKVDGEDSRWWRMDRRRLSYRLPGIEQLEDMRMQWHFYRKVR